MPARSKRRVKLSKKYFIKYTAYNKGNFRDQLFGFIFIDYPATHNDMDKAINEHIKRDEKWRNRQYTVIIECVSIVKIA